MTDNVISVRCGTKSETKLTEERIYATFRQQKGNITGSACRSIVCGQFSAVEIAVAVYGIRDDGGISVSRSRRGNDICGIGQQIQTHRHDGTTFHRQAVTLYIGNDMLDIAAPVLLLAGLNLTTAENVSLLNNFEIVATAVIALLLFKEKISARLWTGIIFVVISCAVLSVESFTAFRFSYGSVFVLLACVCWGVENNCTRRLSDNDPLQVVILKGIFSGSGSLAIALALGQSVSAVWAVFAVMAVGLVAYGLSIFFYVNAQRYIGASRTSAYLCSVAFCRSSVVLYSVQANSSMDIFHCACSNGNGRMAVRFRQTCVCPSE